MKWALYNLLFAAIYPFLLPGFLLRMLRRGGYAARMGDRLALYPESVRFAFRGAKERPVWIHAVSVGEVQVAGQLMREWRQVEPTVRFLFSTTSSTGWKMAERELASADVLIYNPLDFPNFVKSALRTFSPRSLVLTESEIWPNFIRQARRMGIPAFLINARVSDRSAPRYRAARWFFGEVLGAFERIFVQSELDRDRLAAAGSPPAKLEVTGSFKFDVARRNPAKEAELDAWLRPRAAKLIVGGSTWPGEDKVLLRLLGELKAQRQSVTLVIAPRHFEKADAVEANIRSAGYECVRRSRGDAGREGAVYLADTTGELMGLYGIADLVFVGKSLCAHGSQNMIEPCLCGKPTLVGPYTENFRPVMSDLKASEAIVQVNSATELAERAKALLNDDGGLGARAREAVLRRVGVVGRCVKAIRSALCLVLALVLVGCSKTEEQPPRDEYVFEPVRIASAYIAMLEKPDATRSLLIGEPARKLEAYFQRAGVKADTRARGKYDLVVIGCEEMTRESCARAGEYLSENGVMVWLLDIGGVACSKFKTMLDAFALKSVRLWMPGEHHWVLTGRKEARKLKLEGVLELFAREGTFADLAKAGSSTLPELFANYAGTREELMAAFTAGDQTAAVEPEYFLTREIPAVDWIVPEGADEDIARQVFAEMRSMQVVRRLVVEGNLLSLGAKDKQGEEAAIEKWNKAALRNPNDLFILERLDRLDRNAKGFLDLGRVLQAMKCYETMVLIKATPTSVHNFGMCLKKLGKLDLAEKVLKRAESMAVWYNNRP